MACLIQNTKKPAKCVHRFSERPKRIARREERDLFSTHIKPLIWIFGLLGATGLFTLSLHYQVTGESVGLYWYIALAPIAAALLCMVFRVVRGHFDDELND